MSESSPKFTDGDEVATPDGRGVVAAVLTSDFEFPHHEDELTDVTASEDDIAYVVGLETVGSAVYRDSAIQASDLADDNATQSTDGDAVTDIIDEDVNGLDSLPEGWDRDSVLEYWSSIGGTWEECVTEMSDELGDDRAKEHCSAMKDEVLRTQRWRNRF